MARLGTKFAGIVEVSVDDGRATGLIDELESPTGAPQLEVGIERIDDSTIDESSDVERARWEMQLIGQDRPGIVHEISQVLAHRNVSIEEMQTSTSSAPMSGESLFNATAVLVAVGPVDPDAVATDLEALANELMVDIELNI